MDGLYTRFSALEPIFAVVVLASNFLKQVVFRGLNEMQRVAVLIATVLLIFTMFTSYQLRPMLEERRGSIPTLNQPAPNSADDIVKFNKVRSKYEVFLTINLVLGLFMVYAYRSFEERKLQAITKILKAP
jgi:hypothetical protein